MMVLLNGFEVKMMMNEFEFDNECFTMIAVGAKSSQI